MNSKRTVVVTMFGAALLATAIAQRTFSRVTVEFVPDRATGLYAVGDKVGWTVRVADGVAKPTTPFSYVVRLNNQTVIQSGSLDLSMGSQHIEVKATEPAMVMLAVSPARTETGFREGMAAAAVSPRDIKPAVVRPRDFDAFWRDNIRQLSRVPMNPVLTPHDSGVPGVDFATIQLDHVDGGHVYGQLAKPSRPGKFPAMLILQWASPPYPLQKPWVTGRAAEGWLTLNIEPHDVLPDQPQSYYDALPVELKNYAAVGRDDRNACYFRKMYMADYRAVDYLTSRADWDGKTLVVMGTSMGGQQSLCVAGLHPKITHVIVEEPSGCDTNGPLHGRQAGYPNFPPNDPKAMETALYFDAVNFAPHIRAKALVAMGFVDTVAPPVGIWTAFNLIRGQKEAAPMVDAPHNNIATTAQQMPYYQRSSAWLSALVHGQPVDIHK